MKILSYNVRGLGNAIKLKSIRSVVKTHGVQLYVNKRQKNKR